MRPLAHPLVQRVAFKLGYLFEGREPVDLRNRASDVIEAAYLAGSKPFLVEAKISDCRGLGGFRYDGANLHPYMQTAVAILRREADGYAGSPLERYYNHFQPKCAADVLRLPGEISSELKNAPPIALKLPWEEGTWQRKLAVSMVRERADNRSRGRDLSFEHGASEFGPVSPDKGRLEFETLKLLVEKVQRRGYRRHDGPDGDIFALPLIDRTNRVRFLIRGGKHRMAVVAALGYETVSLRLLLNKAPPRLQEVQYWPRVRSGVYSAAQAEDVFQSIFSGEPISARIPKGWNSELTDPFVSRRILQKAG